MHAVTLADAEDGDGPGAPSYHPDVMSFLLNQGDAGRSRHRRAFWAVFGLVYLVPLVRTASGYHGARLPLAFLGIAAFVALYVATPLSMESWARPAGRRTWVLYGAFAAVCAVLPPAFGADWNGMPIYLAVISAMVLPFRWVPAGVAGATLLVAAQALAAGLSRSALTTLAVSALSVGLFMFGFRHARTLVQQLQDERAKTARLAAVEERLRIARDLHDLLGHSLSLIVLKSELARRVGERDPARTLAEVGDIETVARTALADVREAISGYRRRSLAEEIDGARAVLAAAGVEAAVRTAGPDLPDEVDALFGWAVREAVTNVVRHARAGRCTVEVRRDGGDAVLEVRDDGAGGAASPGNGLTGLAERAAEAGGSATAGPGPQGGFRVIVRAPLARPAVPVESTP
ncbi:sensor histidine kinase [Actinomadura parmotrematis]|uniref:Sensor histidine kinase n=1 Tax=Actinomadura parmotrematis TaxID=2864039 RepID=A0ABS7FRD0_9ACTN|nr:sensor histidine kinase [Actinomadura parmotrematis]MBW8482959.1 sensor histidine kinase [Actinomadura parmotrematis]